MKVQTKCTPGPWMVDSERPSGQIVVVSEFGEIAQVFGGNNPDDETAPNAYLIAAAPDQHEALLLVSEGVNTVIDNWDFWTDDQKKNHLLQLQKTAQEAHDEALVEA